MKEAKRKKYNLGRYLEELRLRSNMSLRDVQKKTGISYAYISQIEKGKREYPGLNILRKLASVYDVALSELVDVTNPDRNKGITRFSPDAMPFTRLILYLSKENRAALLKYLRFLVKSEDKKIQASINKELKERNIFKKKGNKYESRSLRPCKQ